MTGGPTGGVSEGNVRDPDHPSHPQTPLNKGISDNHVRDEHLLVKNTHHISLWRLQIFLSSLHTLSMLALFLLKKQKTFGYSKKYYVICVS